MEWSTDLRYALRLFRKSPLFTIVAVATLALGIGANAVIFSAVDALVIRSLPYSDPDRVALIWEDNTRAGFPKNTPAPANFADWRRMNRTFEDIAATRGATSSLTGDGQPEQVLGRAVTPNFFAVLGVAPQRGRTFTEQENETGAAVVVISHGLWQRRYGGDPSIVGRTLLMNDNRYEVIGVMPRTFVFRNREIDYWVPVHFAPAVAADRGSHFLNVVGRLKSGVTLTAAREDMRSVARRLSEQYPDSNGNIGVVVEAIKDDMLGNTRLELLVLMGAALSVLLIACANLASLLLSRAAGRRGELAVRAALGATRGRLARQLVVEGLLLSTLGALAGLAMVPAASPLLAGLTPIGAAPVAWSAVDPRVLAFTCALALVTGLLFSIAPALQAGGAALQRALHEQSRGAVGAGSRLTRDTLVVLQIAAAVVLLVATGLMIRTLANIRAIDIGFKPDHLLTMRTTLPRPKYADPVARVSFFDRVIAGVKMLPGVEHAGFGSNPPFTSAGNTTFFMVEGQALTRDRINDALYRGTTTDYLTTLGVQAVEGRLFDERDVAGAERAVVINETLARQFFPNESPLGHQMRFSTRTSPLYRIVGVVRDVRERGYQAGMKPGAYLSTSQAPESWAVPEYLVLRVRGRPEDYADAVRRVIASVDPAQPVSAVRTMDDIMDIEVADRQQQMVLLGAFAALALVVASMGLYALLAYAVAQRSREIGLRIALGATRGAVVSMIAARGVTLAAIGLGTGIAAGWAATRAMTTVLYGVQPNDPSTYAAVVVLLGLIATAASIVPAARAARVDPMVVLRDE
jgi:putative ABC transport system permease protein